MCFVLNAADPPSGQHMDNWSQRAVLLLLLLTALAGPSYGSSLQSLDSEELQLLRRLNPHEALQAYHDCTDKFGKACQVPCKALPGCAGCVETVSGKPVCSYCLVGHFLTQDGKCEACPEGSVSKGGYSTSCESCPPGFHSLGALRCLADTRRSSVPTILAEGM